VFFIDILRISSSGLGVAHLFPHTISYEQLREKFPERHLSGRKDIQKNFPRSKRGRPIDVEVGVRVV
jgi:hypothetical protein